MYTYSGVHLGSLPSDDSEQCGREIFFFKIVKHDVPVRGCHKSTTDVIVMYY